jgi:hypothetical protein
VTKAALAEDDPFRLTVIATRTSGLRNNIWIGTRSHTRHAACMWVQMNHRKKIGIDCLAVVSVENEPPQVLEGHLGAADLAQVRRYIALNRAAILDHWAGRTDSAELSRALRPLPTQ